MTSKPSLDDLRIDRSVEPAGPGRGPLWAAFALILVVTLGLGGWWVFGRTVVEVRAGTVRQQSTASGGAGSVVLNATGYVTARRRATVSSKIAGRIVEVLVEEGMAAADGQVLARLDDTRQTRELALSRAELTASQRGLDEIEVLLREAELERGRVRNMVAEAVASQAELDAAAARVDSLAARLALGREQVTVSRRRVSLREQDLEDTTVRAPFAGVAISKDAQPGEMISPVSGGGGFTRTGICTLVDMTSLEIEVDVSESYINRVTRDQRVEAVLDAYSDWKIPASVITTIPAADRQKATVRVRIAFERLDPRILPDMGVKVAFLEDEQSNPDGPPPAAKLLAPRAAVSSENGSAVVFVLSGAAVERRTIRTGRVDGDEIEVVSGLAAGERVVIDPPADLADGDTVRENLD